VSYTTGAYSALRLQQLLAQPGYLPLTWTPAGPTAPAIPDASTNARMPAACEPPAGSVVTVTGPVA
jgi:hypothetical protein